MMYFKEMLTSNMLKYTHVNYLLRVLKYANVEFKIY